ncbi:hypothetical protein MIR68_008594 [Amoeboaphelidium protococcarum]|nr:hypothetical protein MIR68_008594 [Amoeboaphelidium protococcarum]
MFEATLTQALVFKRLLGSIQDLVTDVNWDCSDQGIFLQSMDNAHVALVSLLLSAEAFEVYRCDRNITLGINVVSMNKILKCSTDQDKLTLSASDDADVIGFKFEGKNERVGEYDLKLMDIEQEHLAIPDTDYEANVTMSAAEFQRICRDLATLGESMVISVNKESVRFSVEGELGNGTITIRQNSTVDAGKKSYAIDDDDEDDEDEEEESSTQKKGRGGKKKGDVEADYEPTIITLDSAVSQMFSLKYLGQFSKASTLAKRVNIRMSQDVPLLVEYVMDNIGHLRYYLAPKINNDEDMA